MKENLISERDIVLVLDTNTNKPRPGIVLELKADRQALLIAGTGTPRDLPRIEVRPESRVGKALGVYKPTYFYASNERTVLTSELKSTGKVCPPELFFKLRDFVKSSNR